VNIPELFHFETIIYSNDEELLLLFGQILDFSLETFFQTTLGLMVQGLGLIFLMVMSPLSMIFFFVDLILSNIGFSNSYLFPNVDIKNISKKIQIEMLKDGMLLPEILLTLNDMRFKFK
jgi:hypothetical protein